MPAEIATGRIKTGRVSVLDRPGRLEAAAQRQRDEAIANAEVQRRVGREITERTREREHQRTVYEKLVATERFRNEAVAAARRQAVQQQRHAMIADLEKDIAALNPPPAPEAPVVIVEQPMDGSPDFGSDFNPALFNKKPRSWW